MLTPEKIEMIQRLAGAARRRFDSNNHELDSRVVETVEFRTMGGKTQTIPSKTLTVNVQDVLDYVLDLEKRLGQTQKMYDKLRVIVDMRTQERLFELFPTVQKVPDPSKFDILDL